MEQSPSGQADSHFASQGITRFLWNLKVHYGVHKSPPQIPVQSQMYQVHTFQHYFPKIRSNIIPHLRLGLPSGLFPSGVRSHKLYPNSLSLRIIRLQITSEAKTDPLTNYPKNSLCK